MNIQVNDFRWEPGKNDAEYIKLLESAMDEWQKLAQKAIAKLKAQEPHRKGYWIYPLSTDCSCSECGNQPEHEPGGSVPLYDYCPYCGAEMEVKWK